MIKLAPRAFDKLFCQPLLLHPNARAGLEAGLLAHMGLAQSDFSHPVTDNREDTVLEVFGNLAIVKIHGVIDKQISQIEALCYGGCDLSVVDRALLKIAHDETIERVILDINSPGGSVTGVQETAARIAALRETKEVHVFSETQVCSAAFWLASQADVITATPSSTLGSIGVYIALLDQTKQLEMQGLKVDLIKAGRLKAMGSAFKAITDEERAILQASVDNLHRKFKDAVTTLRKVSDDAMQGQSFDGEEALKLGLIDNVTNQTLEEYAAELLLQ
jgi:signal peptide peptidase SppA